MSIRVDSEVVNKEVRVMIYRMKQDDPRRCTAARLCRLSFAHAIYRRSRIPSRAIVLNPFAEGVFTLQDRRNLESGLVAIDCSWKNVDSVFRIRLRGVNRRLPPLLAVNPINYGCIGLLSSAEALASALYISGYIDQAKKILSVFKWGPNFLVMNHDPLEDYRRVKDADEMASVARSYFPT